MNVVAKWGKNVEYEDGCLLGCCAVLSSRMAIALMMEAASTTEKTKHF
jgi:hypothetical protein